MNLKQHLYKKECMECKKIVTTISICHIWNVVYCTGTKEDCDNPELTDEELEKEIAKGGTIKY